MDEREENNTSIDSVAAKADDIGETEAAKVEDKGDSVDMKVETSEISIDATEAYGLIESILFLLNSDNSFEGKKIG